MTDGHERELERGMELVSRVHDVDEDELTPQVRKIFEDLRSTLRVPLVNYLFRALARYPAFLEEAWFHVRPHLRTRAFELEADRLRAEALLEPVPEGSGLLAAAEDDLPQLRSFTETIYYVLPKLLLIASALEACLPRETDEAPPEGGAEGFHGGAGLLPLGVAEGTVALPMVSPGEAPEEVRGVFEEIKRRHHHPGVATYYRALGNWPRFLSQVWSEVKPIVDSPPFLERRQRLIAHAERVVRVWVEPLPAEELEAAGLRGSDEQDLRAILTAFRLRMIPDLLLDVSLIHALLEGPGDNGRSRFSAAGPASEEEGAGASPS
jgi:hypothetical protein